MVTRGKKNSHMKSTGKMRDRSPSFITCQSEYFTTTAVETATAVHLSRPVALPTQIAVDGNSETEGDNVDEKGV